MTLWISNGAVLKSSSTAIKRTLKMNSSWTELFNFQKNFNCH